jgi:hypothetical protein
MDKKIINKLPNPRSSVIFEEFAPNNIEVNKNNENSYTIRVFNKNTNGLWVNLSKDDLENFMWHIEALMSDYSFTDDK